MDVNRPEPAEGDGPGVATPEPLNSGPTHTSVTLTSYRSGPLPPVGDFAGYEQVLPGAAERIFAMAEKAQDAAIELDAKESKAARIGFLFSTFSNAYFPILALAFTFLAWFFGSPGLAAFGALLTTVTGGPQIYVSVRNAFNRDRGNGEVRGGVE
jgi:uncharacterized membrane protein